MNICDRTQNIYVKVVNFEGLNLRSVRNQVGLYFRGVANQINTM